MKLLAWVHIIRKFRDKKPKFLSNNTVIFLICLLIASLMWFVNALSKQYQSELLFNVQYQHMPEDLILVSEPVEQLYLYTESTGFNLLAYKLRKTPTVTIDYSRIGRGSVVPVSSIVSEINAQLPPDLHVMRIRPDTIYLDFDHLLEKRVPVVPAFRLTYNRQYDRTGEIVILPDTVILAGPNDLIEKIDYWETDSLILSDIKNPVEIEVELKAPENHLISFRPEKVRVYIPVEQFTEKILDIPVVAVGMPEDQSYSIFPKNVEVSVQVPLSRYERISASMFELRADFDEINIERDNRVPVSVHLKPDDVKNLRFSPSSLEFIIYD